MAKSIAQRLAALEKTVAAFFTGSPKKTRKTKAKRKAAKKAKKSSRARTTKATSRRKTKGGRRAAALPFPPG
jgi:hypothetical protein